jgi:hypothetical protein
MRSWRRCIRASPERSCGWADGSLHLGSGLSLGRHRGGEGTRTRLPGSVGTDDYAKAFHKDEAASGNVLPPEEMPFIAMHTRNACTPNVAARLDEIWSETDVRGVLRSAEVVAGPRVEGEQKFAEVHGSRVPRSRHAAAIT